MCVRVKKIVRFSYLEWGERDSQTRQIDREGEKLEIDWKVLVL